MPIQNLDDPMARGPSVQAHPHYEPPPVEVMSEIEFHDRSILVASSLLNEVATKNGKLKNKDMVRVEKALATARAVITATEKARASLRQAREDQIFEQAVISAAGVLERPQQEAFMTALQDSLDTLSEVA